MAGTAKTRIHSDHACATHTGTIHARRTRAQLSHLRSTTRQAQLYLPQATRRSNTTGRRNNTSTNRNSSRTRSSINTIRNVLQTEAQHLEIQSLRLSLHLQSKTTHHRRPQWHKTPTDQQDYLPTRRSRNTRRFRSKPSRLPNLVPTNVKIHRLRRRLL